LSINTDDAYEYWINSDVGRALTVIAFGLVMLFGLGITVGDVVPNESLNDKVEHVVAFFVLALGLLLFWELSVLRAGVVLAVYGIAIELLQLKMPDRHGSVMDFMADIAGMAIGLVLFRIIEFIRRGSRT